jgi:rubrerythrin
MIMANIFSLSEIVELGIQIEINGRDFYKAVLERPLDQKARDIFAFLGKEEERHIADFQKILDSVAAYEPRESYPEEYFAYMNALASEYVFTQKGKGREAASKIRSDMDAVDLGIGFEKDSILFYEEMKKMVHKKEQKIVDLLIDSEKSHLRKLSELKASLKS